MFIEVVPHIHIRDKRVFHNLMDFTVVNVLLEVGWLLFRRVSRCVGVISAEARHARVHLAASSTLHFVDALEAHSLLKVRISAGLR